MDASYCSAGQKLEASNQILVRLRSRAQSWLSGMRERTPAVIFLLDGTDRVTFRSKYEYVVDRVLGGVSQITFHTSPDELLRIANAKTVEFQVTGEAYKLKQKELGKLKDLAESATSTSH